MFRLQKQSYVEMSLKQQLVHSFGSAQLANDPLVLQLEAEGLTRGGSAETVPKQPCKGSHPLSRQPLAAQCQPD